MTQRYTIKQDGIGMWEVIDTHDGHICNLYVFQRDAVAEANLRNLNYRWSLKHQEQERQS